MKNVRSNKMLILWSFAALVVLIAGFFSFFYRDPERIPPSGDIILCPADGLVIDVSQEDGWEKIAIFMSPLNVHVQWVPYNGKVISVERVKGEAKPGFQKSAAKNCQVITVLDTKMGKVLVKQIVGIFVRRIITFFKVGDELRVGQRFGRIAFGSRVELWLPADRVEVKVKKWQNVLAGVTIAAVPK